MKNVLVKSRGRMSALERIQPWHKGEQIFAFWAQLLEIRFNLTNGKVKVSTKIPFYRNTSSLS